MTSTHAVVLLHAFPLNSGLYQRQSAESLGVDRLLALDFRGFGSAPLGDDDPALELLAADVVVSMDDGGIDTAYVVGTSLGGYVALELLTAAPERIAGLVLSGAKARQDTPEAGQARRAMADQVERDGSIESIRSTLLPKLLAASSWEEPEVAAYVDRAAESADPASIAWVQRAMATRPEYFSALRSAAVPVFAIVGELDGLASAQDAEAIADAAPDGAYRVLPGVGHLACLEDPASWNQAVREFISAH